MKLSVNGITLPIFDTHTILRVIKNIEASNEDANILIDVRVEGESDVPESVSVPEPVATTPVATKTTPVAPAITVEAAPAKPAKGVKAKSIKVTPKAKKGKAVPVTENAVLTAKLPTIKPASAELPEWVAGFNTEGIDLIEVKTTQINVKPTRGCASKFHDEFRAAGFTWSKKKQFWWAPKDAAKRQLTAARSAEIDRVNASMTPEQRKAYWAAKRAERNA